MRPPPQKPYFGSYEYLRSITGTVLVVLDRADIIEAIVSGVCAEIIQHGRQEGPLIPKRRTVDQGKVKTVGIFEPGGKVGIRYLCQVRGGKGSPPIPLSNPSRQNVVLDIRDRGPKAQINAGSVIKRIIENAHILRLIQRDSHIRRTVGNDVVPHDPADMFDGAVTPFTNELGRGASASK